MGPALRQTGRRSYRSNAKWRMCCHADGEPDSTADCASTGSFPETGAPESSRLHRPRAADPPECGLAPSREALMASRPFKMVARPLYLSKPTPAELPVRDSAVCLVAGTGFPLFRSEGQQHLQRTSCTRDSAPKPVNHLAACVHAIKRSGAKSRSSHG